MRKQEPRCVKNTTGIRATANLGSDADFSMCAAVAEASTQSRSAIQALKTRGTVKDGARVDSVRGGTWIGACTILSCEQYCI